MEVSFLDLFRRAIGIALDAAIFWLIRQRNAQKSSASSAPRSMEFSSQLQDRMEGKTCGLIQFVSTGCKVFGTKMSSKNSWKVRLALSTYLFHAHLAEESNMELSFSVSTRIAMLAAMWGVPPRKAGSTTGMKWWPIWISTEMIRTSQSFAQLTNTKASWLIRLEAWKAWRLRERSLLLSKQRHWFRLTLQMLSSKSHKPWKDKFLGTRSLREFKRSQRSPRTPARRELLTRFAVSQTSLTKVLVKSKPSIVLPTKSR